MACAAVSYLARHGPRMVVFLLPASVADLFLLPYALGDLGGVTVSRRGWQG